MKKNFNLSLWILHDDSDFVPPTRNCSSANACACKGIPGACSLATGLERHWKCRAHAWRGLCTIIPCC